MKSMSRRSFAVAAGSFALASALALAGCATTDAGKDEGEAEEEAPAEPEAEGDAQTADADAAAGEFKLVEPGKLTIGSDLDYKPLEYRDEENNPTGFGVAMAQEICNRIGLEMNFLPAQNFDTLITQVAAGTKMDVAVSSITITDARLEEVDFSTPYYDSNLAIVTSVDAEFESKDDVNGAKVGVQQGSTGEEWVNENWRDSEVTPFTGPTDLMAAMAAGSVEAAVYDEPVARNLVATEYTDFKVLEIIPTGEQYGIAVNKDNPALLAAINGALAEMEEDGTLDELFKTWIG